MYTYVTKPESLRRDFLTCVAGPIWTGWVQSRKCLLNQRNLDSIVNLVFDLRMSSPDGAVEHKGKNVLGNSARRCNKSHEN